MGLIPYISCMKNKVVYFHKRKDTNEVFYVGIGNTNRPYKKTGRSDWWKRIVKKYGYTIEIVHEGLTWDKSVEYELKYIKDFGRKDLGLGPLVNLTDGGEGTLNSNIERTDEWKMNQSLSSRGSNNYATNLTDDDIMDIRKRFNDGVSQSVLCDEYNFSHTKHINAIVSGKLWSHLPVLDRSNRIKCTSKGELLPQSKLTREDVINIRKEFSYNPESTTDCISEKYPVEWKCINMIINRKSWKHIPKIKDELTLSEKINISRKGNRLTPKDVLWIRENYKPRHKVYGAKFLAERFKVSKQSISDIICRRKWSHI